MSSSSAAFFLERGCRNRGAAEVAARVPQTRDYRYTVANDRVLLVGTSRIVVGVFAAAPTHP
jgi:hypothetical protein